MRSCRDVRRAHGLEDADEKGEAETAFIAALAARRRFLRTAGIVPLPATLDDLYRACSQNLDDGRAYWEVNTRRSFTGDLPED